MKSRSAFLKDVGSLTAAAGICAVLPDRGFARAVSGAGKKLPNVVLIMTDDQGWGDIRSHDFSLARYALRRVRAF